MLFRSNDTATTEIYTLHYTLSLHDALPIKAGVAPRAIWNALCDASDVPAERRYGVGLREAKN